MPQNWAARTGYTPPQSRFLGKVNNPNLGAQGTNMPRFGTTPSSVAQPSMFNQLGNPTGYGRQQIAQDQHDMSMSPFGQIFGGGGGPMQTSGGINAGIGQGDVNQGRAMIGAVPFGMSPAAQGSLQTQGNDLSRGQRLIEDTDLQRRAAFEKARQDMTRQVGQADSNIGYGNLLQRFREGDQDLANSQNAFIYDLIGGMFPR